MGDCHKFFNIQSANHPRATYQPIRRENKALYCVRGTDWNKGANGV